MLWMWQKPWHYCKCTVLWFGSEVWISAWMLLTLIQFGFQRPLQPEVFHALIHLNYTAPTQQNARSSCGRALSRLSSLSLNEHQCVEQTQWIAACGQVMCSVLLCSGAIPAAMWKSWAHPSACLHAAVQLPGAPLQTRDPTEGWAELFVCSFWNTSLPPL